MIARNITTLLAALLACMTTCTSLAGTITLRSAVRLPADAAQVRLADIADITGADAEQHAHVIITELTDPTAAVEISLRQVREALDEAGVHWGRISLNGRSVTVRPRRSGAVSPPVPMSSMAVVDAREQAREEQDKPEAHLASKLQGRNTLRSMLATYVAQQLKVTPDHLQLTFDDRHAELLDADAGEARYEIEPVSSIRSSRIDLTVRVWLDGRIDHRRTISITPLVRTPVVIVAKEIRRNDVIEASSLRVEQQWLSPANSSVIYEPVDAAGRHAIVRLREGEMLRETHLRRETLIHRGEQVTVRCLVGSAVVTLQAEARADGSEGDTIEFRKLGERESFLATVTGRNEAILDLSKRSAQ